jgi:hypothetical protein
VIARIRQFAYNSQFCTGGCTAWPPQFDNS